MLVGEDVRLVAVEDPDPHARARHRTAPGAAAAPVAARHVRHSRVVVDGRRRTRRQPGEPSAGVDNEVRRPRGAVDHHADGGAVALHERVDVAVLDGEAFDLGGCRAQRPFVGRAAGTDDHRRHVGAGERHVDRFGTERPPPLPRLGPLRRQQVDDLVAEAVGMLELHGATTSPGSASRRARIAIGDHDAVPPPCEHSAAGEAGRAGANDDRSRMTSSFSYTHECVDYTKSVVKWTAFVDVAERRPVPVDRCATSRRGPRPAADRRRRGRDLFVERGYAATTIDAIAERAEVSRKTVFTSVGGKAARAQARLRLGLAGDDEPVPIADRPCSRYAE